jgi:hypothetical protein
VPDAVQINVQRCWASEHDGPARCRQLAEGMQDAGMVGADALGTGMTIQPGTL